MSTNVKPCKVCGGVKRNKYGKCIECRKKSHKKWSDKHPEYQHNWYQANMESVRERAKRWSRTHPDRKRSNDKEYYAKNTDKRRAQSQEWYQSNKERRREYKRLPEVRRRYQAHQARRRSLKKGSKGTVTAQQFKELCERYDNKCLACGKKVTLTMDHVIPLSKGGIHDISNIQPLCLSCNSSKYDKYIDYRFRHDICSISGGSWPSPPGTIHDDQPFDDDQPTSP